MLTGDNGTSQGWSQVVPQGENCRGQMEPPFGSSVTPSPWEVTLFISAVSVVGSFLFSKFVEKETEAPGGSVDGDKVGQRQFTLSPPSRQGKTSVYTGSWVFCPSPGVLCQDDLLMGLDQMHFLQGGYAQPPRVCSSLLWTWRRDVALSTDPRPGEPVIHPTSRVSEVRKPLTGQPWGEALGARPLNLPP